MSQSGEIRPAAPVIRPGHTPATVTDAISALVLTRPTPYWWLLGFAVAFGLMLLFLYTTLYLFARGLGIWGVNAPVMWAFDIINFTWWIGIGHAGTLISALLLLLHQKWRVSLSRFAEAMTLFAIATATLFPFLHLGRPHFFYWLMPYPNTMGLWPQWRSPLVWDVFAVTAHGTLALLFWYIGLLPDLATMRDRARHRVARLAYGVLALGWRGDAAHWHRYERAYFMLALIAVPLIVSVHSIIGLEFAVTLLPSWHSTLLPFTFVVSGLFSGFAMVLTIVIPLRVAFGLHDFITTRHLDNIAKIILGSGLFLAYSYLVELLAPWFSDNEIGWAELATRVPDPYLPLYGGILFANVLLPQLLWFRRVRTNGWLLFPIALLVNVGVWLERFALIVGNLSEDFLPSAWDVLTPTLWDWATLVGSLGLFFTLLFLLIRLLPVISMVEMQELADEGAPSLREVLEP